MKLLRSNVLHALVAACLAAGALDAVAAGPARAACALKPATGDVPSQAADALSVALDAAHPAGLANWDVRWWNKHRVWVTLVADNQADAPAHLLPQLLVDARPDGGAAGALVGPSLTVPPHARASERLSVYVPDDARTLGLRVLGATLAGRVTASVATECSDARYDVGERALAIAPLMDEALRVYFNGFVDPLPDPHAAYDQARLLGSGAQDGGDVVWTLRALMQAVRDAHGWIVGPGEPPPAHRPLATRAPEFELRPDGTAIVRLHALDTDADAAAAAWAVALHDGVAALAARHPRAWVLDLRDHDADAPWPAFAALSALLDGPAIGGFVSRSDTQHWIVDRGVARLAGGPALVDVQAAPEAPVRAPLALLIGPGTRNGGEELVVAFRGRAHTRTFGSATAGFPTAGVTVHQLSDGSLLGVLETRAADRTGVVHREPIEPDDLLREDERAAALPPPALEWLAAESNRP